MAVTGHITVTPEELETQAGVVQKELNNMQTHFEQVKTLIEGTTAYWTGEAGDSYRADYQNKQSTVEEMFQRYAEHVKDLGTMAGVYREAEESAANLADELPVSTL